MLLSNLVSNYISSAALIDFPFCFCCNHCLHSSAFAAFIACIHLPLLHSLLAFICLCCIHCLHSSAYAAFIACIHLLLLQSLLAFICFCCIHCLHSSTYAAFIACIHLLLLQSLLGFICFCCIHSLLYAYPLQLWPTFCMPLFFLLLQQSWPSLFTFAVIMPYFNYFCCNHDLLYLLLL